MKEKKHYVYKITNENDLALYVGQTKNIESRVKNHLSNRHWIQEGYKFYVLEMKSKTDSDIYEIYYINKLNPFYNIANANNKSFSIELPDIKFKLFKTVSTDDLILRNKRFIDRNDIDKNPITIGEKYASRLSSSPDESIINCQFKFTIYKGEPITILKYKLEDKVDVMFYIKGGLHKFFDVKSVKKHIHNIEMYLFMISMLMNNDGKVDEDYTMADLDTLDLSRYELITKEEADIIRQNKKNKESDALSK